MIKKCFYIFILLCLHISAKAQNPEADSLIKLLQYAKEDTSKVMLLRNIGAAVSNEDPAKAIEYWKKGIELSRKLNYTVGLARNFINIGTGFSYLGKFDSTIRYADSGILYSKKTNNPDRLALVYLNKGDAYRNLGDFKSALLYCDTASMYAAQTSNTDRQARIYDIISDLYAAEKQYVASIAFQNKALELYIKDNNAVMEGQSYDDLAWIYQETGKLDTALILRKMAIRIGEDEQDYKNLSGYYYGAAAVYIDKENYKDAEAYAAKSLFYAEQQQNNTQLATIYTLLSKLYLKEQKLEEAIKAGNTAYNFALAEAHIAWQSESAASLAEAYTKTGDFKNANHFLTISNQLKDSITQQTFNTQVAALQSSFEMKEKDKTILLLNKDKELQQQKLKQQNLFMFGAILIALFALVGVWLLINRNKLKHKMEELELRGKIAADLHDEVGSTLSSIRMYSDIVKRQTQSDVSTALLDKISSNSKEMIENMSDIVWMIKPGNDDFKNVENRMLNFANELCSPSGINFEFNKDAATDVIQISMEQRRDLYLIFKEAINNAVKYSGCHSIHAAITLQNHQLEIRISDDGNGFDISAAKKGNGLSNMQKRAMIHKGTCNIQSAINEGTEIIVSFPV
jgi:two-component system, NarL family, sensor histidine kinase UhpB